MNPATAGWSTTQRQMATAVLDLLRRRSSHGRLTEVWNLDTDQAIRAVTGGIDLLLDAIRNGRPPDTEHL